MSHRAIKVFVDLEEFVAQPLRAAYFGRTFTFYNFETLRGYRFWGQPRVAEVQQVAACISAAILALPRGAPSYSLVDLSAVDGVPSACFEAFLEYSRSIRSTLATQMVRQAVVRQAGLMDAVCSSFKSLLEPGHELFFFDSMSAAARWLDPPDRADLELLARALDEGIPHAGSITAGLRRWLSTNLEYPSPALAAKALGVSLRTMQRRLNGEKTSFNELLRLERVEAAQRLLVDSPLKISAIALEVGFSSSQQLSTSFKEVTSMTPSEFQSRFRAHPEFTALGARTNNFGARTEDVSGDYG
jgi:AraC-like DNA-binding protein